jgi:hypothetical protein
MRLSITIVPATVLAIALVVGGLWAWQGAWDLAWDWASSRPDIVAWGIRSAAVAAIAAAQIILIALVLAKAYRRGTFDLAVALTTGAIFALASVSAIACGLAGR